MGFGEEETFTPENSVIRNKGSLITITHRASREVYILGDMRLMPFQLFKAELHLELSHFETSLNGKRSIVRYLMH